MSIKPQRIYVAGALSSKESTQRDPTRVVTDYIQNVSRMCQAASIIRRKGHYPYIPGLDLLIGLVVGNWKEEDYRGLGMNFLEVCDAIVVISYSWGVKEELEFARKLGLVIYYTLEEVPDARV